MTSTPPPPAGWVVKDVVPTSQQQAQDTVVGYLKRTLAALPAGTVIDATRYGTAGVTGYCDDNDSSPSAPRRYSTLGELKTPPGVDATNIVATVGDIWRGWGWYVLERDGFPKPNEFGYAPDGYTIHIAAARQAGYPPSIQAGSPCYPGQIARDDIPVPTILTAQ
ncbi:MAG: hypothetical protein HYZ38_14560 [Mycobacterium sp.]|nr:hypothetical protein [Mycobacterium sp.]